MTQIRRAFKKNTDVDQYQVFDELHRKFIQNQLKELCKEKLDTPDVDKKSFKAYYHRYADEWIISRKS